MWLLCLHHCLPVGAAPQASAEGSTPAGKGAAHNLSASFSPRGAGTWRQEHAACYREAVGIFWDQHPHSSTRRRGGRGWPKSTWTWRTEQPSAGCALVWTLPQTARLKRVRRLQARTAVGLRAGRNCRLCSRVQEQHCGGTFKTRSVRTVRRSCHGDIIDVPEFRFKNTWGKGK